MKKLFILLLFIQLVSFGKNPPILQTPSPVIYLADNLDEQDNNAIFLPIMHWVKIKFKNNHTLLGVLCNYKYDKKKEYINNFQKFKNLK